MNDYLKDIRGLVGPGCIHLPSVRTIIVNEAGEVLLQRCTDIPTVTKSNAFRSPLLFANGKANPKRTGLKVPR